MKCCNKEDILYTTGHNELYVRKYVGMEGYLANSTEELMKKRFSTEKCGITQNWQIYIGSKIKK